jgi:thiol-disulfide isomerase/thioredoxin
MRRIVLTLIALFALNISLYADNMEMTDTDGKIYKVVGEKSKLKIEGMEGKVVFLELFGLQCPACRQAMPHLINLQEKYKDKLQVMAIEVQKNDAKAINAFKQKNAINYTTLSNFDVGFVVQYIMSKSGWKGEIPFTVIIDADGQVQFTEVGIIPEKKLEEYMERFSKK